MEMFRRGDVVKLTNRHGYTDSKSTCLPPLGTLAVVTQEEIDEFIHVKWSIKGDYDGEGWHPWRFELYVASKQVDEQEIPRFAAIAGELGE
jgi:hypothetical protein